MNRLSRHNRWPWKDQSGGKSNPARQTARDAGACARLVATGTGIFRLAALALGALLVLATASSAFQNSALGPQSTQVLLQQLGTTGMAPPPTTPPAPTFRLAQAGQYSAPSQSPPSKAPLVRAVEAEEQAYYQQTGQYIPATQDNLRVLMQKIGAPEQAAAFVWGLMLSYGKEPRQSPQEYVRGKGDLIPNMSPLPKGQQRTHCRYELTGPGIGIGSLDLLYRAVEAEEQAYYQQTGRYIDANERNFCLLMERIGAENNYFLEKLLWKKMQEYSQGRHTAPSPRTEGGWIPTPSPQPDQSSEAQTQADPETCQKACQNYKKCMENAREAELLSKDPKEQRALSLGASMRARCSLFRDQCPTMDCESQP